ncbi:hypothetical protein BpHYR1_041044 [Brachionus plicatilis]|uniref:Uncharacterized protein n=1 Tax=Brachionus plicatilis TaxID=10195 RepID=A0A3M7P3K2_BRAPC|nr:hypothetical protein BpHYR1_041044 [Brachionus plicatilis]
MLMILGNSQEYVLNCYLQLLLILSSLGTCPKTKNARVCMITKIVDPKFLVKLANLEFYLAHMGPIESLLKIMRKFQKPIM